jgi:hypothetical protein
LAAVLKLHVEYFEAYSIHIPSLIMAQVAVQTLVLPGEEISTDTLPAQLNSSGPLKLGPGLRHVPPSSITPTIAGSLFVDHKKKAIWVENNTGRVNFPVLSVPKHDTVI